MKLSFDIIELLSNAFTATLLSEPFFYIGLFKEFRGVTLSPDARKLSCETSWIDPIYDLVVFISLI